uniref:Coiled-coil domain-containing protein 66-like n=1 Tax=Saccoglossus kowalevskii TaxID=10224 RepID=A0ABM0M0C1_SACKO|nr:PREDICTED: coiled-coil domain-containing protein 66-like [Saccoglossus kowalevskii]
MNIGEGLRIAALAKQGSAGVYLLGNPDPVKKKKFSYKKKAQKYPLRRPGTQLQKAATQDENNENESQVKKKPSVDFIKRNTVAVKNTGGPGKQKSRTKLDNGKKKGDSDMVTMTQKQLNALLAAIGTNIAVESGEVKLTAEKEKSIVSEKSSEALKQKEEVSLEENLLNREEVKVKSPMREQAETEDVPRSQNEKATRQIAGENDYATGMGNIGSIIGTTGYNDRSLAEMKRLQWKQELDDQVALKKKHEGEKRNLRKSQDAELQRSMNEWFPFGRSGGGAPNEVHSVVAPENQHNQSRQTRAPAAYQSLSPPRAQYTQEPAVPAAMRSSFVLGEISPREHQHSAVKREEKQQWLQELEKQRQEMRERKEREKREAMQTYQDTWADQFDTFRGQPQNPRYQTVGTRPKQIVDDAAVTTTTFKSSEPSLHGDAESKSKSAPQTADPMSMRSDFSPANPNNAKSEAYVYF